MLLNVEKSVLQILCQMPASGLILPLEVHSRCTHPIAEFAIERAGGAEISTKISAKAGISTRYVSFGSAAS